MAIRPLTKESIKIIKVLIIRVKEPHIQKHEMIPLPTYLKPLGVVPQDLFSNIKPKMSSVILDDH